MTARRLLGLMGVVVMRGAACAAGTDSDEVTGRDDKVEYGACL